MEDLYRQKFGIPGSMNLKVDVSDSENENAKKVTFTIEYTFKERTEKIVINRFKLKEA